MIMILRADRIVCRIAQNRYAINKGLVYICHGRRAINSSAIFRTVFWDIVCGCGLRCMCLHNTRLSCDFLCGFSGDWSGQIRKEAARQSCNFSAVTAQSPQAFYGIVRSQCGFRAEAVRRYGYGDDVDHLMEHGWLDSEVWFEVVTRFPHQFLHQGVEVSNGDPS